MVDTLGFVNMLMRKRFKPWWETIRDYTLIPMFGSAFILAFGVNPEQYLDCIPSNSSVSSLAGEQTAYINSACFKKLLRDPWQVWNVYVGVFLLAFALIIHLAFSLWYWTKRVKELFCLLQILDDNVRKEEQSNKKFETITDSIGKLRIWRKTISKLQQCEGKSEIVYRYNAFNLFAVLATLLSSVLPVIVLVRIHESNFECILGKEVNGIRNTMCTESKSYVKAPWLAVFLVSLSVNFVIAFVRIKQTCDCTHKKSKKPKKPKENNETTTTTTEADGQAKKEEVEKWLCQKKEQKFLLDFCKHCNDLSESTKKIICGKIYITQYSQKKIRNVEQGRGVAEATKSPEGSPGSGYYRPRATEMNDLKREGFATNFPSGIFEQSMRFGGTGNFEKHRNSESIIDISTNERENGMQGIAVAEAIKSMNFLAHRQFQDYIKIHKGFFRGTAKVNGCGCDAYEFDLLETDGGGYSMLYYILRKEGNPAHEPDVRIIFHVLDWATKGIDISGYKLVRFKDKNMTVSDFLEQEHPDEDGGEWKSLKDEIKKCTGNFSTQMDVLEENAKYRLKII